MFVTVNSNISTPTSSQIYKLQYMCETGRVQAILICQLLDPPPTGNNTMLTLSRALTREMHPYLSYMYVTF